MKKPLAPNPAIWGNLDTAPALPTEPAKPTKKYLSLEEVEAQLLASQRPAQQPVVPAPPPQQVQVPPQLASGPPVPQHVGQQQFVEEKPEFKPSQYRRGPQPQRQQFPLPRQAQFRPPQGAQRSPQRSPQHSPVRQAHAPPSQRPLSYTGPPPPTNFQEIMAAENQRLLAEDAKRRKRNQKIAEMVHKSPTSLLIIGTI